MTPLESILESIGPLRVYSGIYWNPLEFIRESIWNSLGGGSQETQAGADCSGLPWSLFWSLLEPFGLFWSLLDLLGVYSGIY